MTVQSSLPPTTALADVLALMRRDGWLSPPLVPFCVPPVALRGTAVTVELAPGPGPDGGPLEALYRLLSRDLTSAVVVVAGASSCAGAVWGQILSRAARAAGAVGAIVDGGVRDRSQVVAERLPVWGLAQHTVGAIGLAHVRAIGSSVRIGAVTVRPGDVVVVDECGAVALPAAAADGLVAAAREYANAESAVLADLTDGVGLVDAYEHKRRVASLVRDRRI